MRAIGKPVCRPTDVFTPWHLHGFEPNPEAIVTIAIVIITSGIINIRTAYKKMSNKLH